jgi:hypothetical protein
MTGASGIDNFIGIGRDIYANVASNTTVIGNNSTTAFKPRGQLQLDSQNTVSSSTTNTVTNKIKIQVAGTTYYLLASTSGT